MMEQQWIFNVVIGAMVFLNTIWTFLILRLLQQLARAVLRLATELAGKS